MEFGATHEQSEPVERSELAAVGRLLIAYEEFGDPADETLLLVMGLGMQMIGWDERFCELLAGRGFHVVRFDNRDVGLSGKCHGQVNIRAGMLGLTGSAVYTLDDMAADTAGLLDHLGVDRAHLVGASMGGMISQKLAATRPERVLSLCSIMAGTGRRRLATLPKPNVLGLLLRPASGSREDFIEQTVAAFELIGSPGFPRDDDLLRARAARSFDRGFNPAGTARQLMAILASGNRTSELRRIKAPTVVIHGEQDRLVPVAAGREVAAAIPGSRLEIIAGMGHDLPQDLWPRFADLIETNARKAIATGATGAAGG